MTISTSSLYNVFCLSLDNARSAFGKQTNSSPVSTVKPSTAWEYCIPLVIARQICMCMCGDTRCMSVQAVSLKSSQQWRNFVRLAVSNVLIGNAVDQ